MRHLATLIAITILTTISATAQSTTNGALRQSSVVITNEQDLVGIEFARTNLVMKIHNAANVNEWIDGAGTKWVVSNFWNMTFSDDFAGVQNPAQTNYLFTLPSQYFYESLGFGAYWRMAITEVRYLPSTLTSTRQWIVTTNSLVLDPVVGTGASGYAYLTYWTTTNTYTIATRTDVTNATIGISASTRTLTDASPTVSVNWGARHLYDSEGRLTADWGGGIFLTYHPSYGYKQSIDWVNRALIDSSERTSMAWGDRNLQFSNYEIALDWSVDNVVTINGSVLMTGTALAETELHRDSATNVIWKSVYSNGWMWLVAYTNYPAN